MSIIGHDRDAWMEEAGSRAVSAGAAVESSVWWLDGSRSQGAGGAVQFIRRNSSGVDWLDATSAKSSDSISTKCSVVRCRLSSASSKRPPTRTEISNNSLACRSQRVDSISSTQSCTISSRRRNASSGNKEFQATLGIRRSCGATCHPCWVVRGSHLTLHLHSPRRISSISWKRRWRRFVRRLLVHNNH